jgi:squalene monooxygenase
MRLVDTINLLLVAANGICKQHICLHTEISSSDQDPSRKEMKEAFFNYFSLGGVFSDGLMALLSGLNPDPLSLVFHCFAMLAYAVGRLLLPFPTPKRMCIAARLILVCISSFLYSYYQKLFCLNCYSHHEFPRQT